MLFDGSHPGRITCLPSLSISQDPPQVQKPAKALLSQLDFLGSFGADGENFAMASVQGWGGKECFASVCGVHVTDPSVLENIVDRENPRTF